MFGEIGFYLSSPSNREKVLALLGEHLYLAIVPLLIGLAVAVPLGWFAGRGRAFPRLGAREITNAALQDSRPGGC